MSVKRRIERLEQKDGDGLIVAICTEIADERERLTGLRIEGTFGCFEIARSEDESDEQLRERARSECARRGRGVAMLLDSDAAEL